MGTNLYSIMSSFTDFEKKSGSFQNLAVNCFRGLNRNSDQYLTVEIQLNVDSENFMQKCDQ